MAAPDTADCWVLHDGRAGNRRQALALAEALSLPFIEMVLQPGALARWLAPRRPASAALCFGATFATRLQSTPPTLAIGCGRIAALATRLARAHGAQAVQILDPRLDPRHWDVLIVPEHDRLRGPSVLTLKGSLHPVDDAWLGQARIEWPALADMATPRTIALIGGPTTAAPLQLCDLDAMLDTLLFWQRRDGGSLMACVSPRTPAAWSVRLAERLAAGNHRLWRGEMDGPNPYAGALAWADRLVLTPDSANMLSEAAATRVPATIAAPGLARGRVGAFAQALIASGRMQELASDVEPMRVIEPLRETARVAAQLRVRLGLR